MIGFIFLIYWSVLPIRRLLDFIGYLQLMFFMVLMPTDLPVNVLALMESLLPFIRYDFFFLVRKPIQNFLLGHNDFDVVKVKNDLT